MTAEPLDTAEAQTRVLVMYDYTERQTLTLTEVAHLFGVGERTVREHVRQGTFVLPIIEIGRRKLVSRASVDKLLGRAS